MRERLVEEERRGKEEEGGTDRRESMRVGFEVETAGKVVNE